MTKSCLALAILCLAWALPAQAFNWQTATARGRDYVTLQSFCAFYNFGYANPGGNTFYDTRSPQHTLRLKMGSPDMFLDGVHYVMSFPVEVGDHDWLVSRMDVIKLFEPIMRPQEIAGRHAIRGVVIDAGHGGTDNGATSRLGAEKDYTRDTAFRLEAILNAAGIKTVLTRRSDVFVDLYERAHIASLYPDYAFVSIHFNSASPEARGLETYCLSPRGAASTSSNYLTRTDIQELTGNDDDALNILLASAVHSEIIKLNPGDPSMDRGVKRARFVVIKANELPAILVEGGFVSNRMEAARVNTPGYRQALAQCIARGLIKFANIMGGRHMSLPGFFSSAPAPPALNVPAATAPSGLQRDVKPGLHSHVPAVTVDGTGNKTTASSTQSAVKTTAPVAHSTHKTKKKKSKLARNAAGKPSGAANPSAITPSPSMLSPTPSTPATDDAATGTKGGTPLGLAEPATPAPTPGADKAPPEPDEPPTVVSTPPKAATPSSSSTNEPSATGQP
jgi:N-acetylmuramoyl-L-alanine amidase